MYTLLTFLGLDNLEVYYHELFLLLWLFTLSTLYISLHQHGYRKALYQSPIIILTPLTYVDFQLYGLAIFVSCYFVFVLIIDHAYGFNEDLADAFGATSVVAVVFLLISTDNLLAYFVGLEMILAILILFFYDKKLQAGGVNALFITNLTLDFLFAFAFLLFVSTFGISDERMLDISSYPMMTIGRTIYQDINIATYAIHIGFTVFILGKFYGFPFNIAVINWFKFLDMRNIAVFMVSMSLPYFSVFMVTSDKIPFFLGCIICMACWISFSYSCYVICLERTLKGYLAHLTVITNNIICLTGLHVVQPEFIFFVIPAFFAIYLMNLLPFLNFILDEKIENFEDLKARFKRANKSYTLFRLFTLLLASGYPASYLYFVKINMISSVSETILQAFLVYGYVFYTYYSLFIVVTIIMLVLAEVSVEYRYFLKSLSKDLYGESNVYPFAFVVLFVVLFVIASLIIMYEYMGLA